MSSRGDKDFGSAKKDKKEEEAKHEDPMSNTFTGFTKEVRNSSVKGVLNVCT